MLLALLDQPTWMTVDRDVLQTQLYRAMLRPSLRIGERKRIVEVFEKCPHQAWRALDECWLPPEVSPSRDPVILALRRFAAGRTEDLPTAEFERFACAHERPLGFLRAVVLEAILLSRLPVTMPEMAIAPLHIAAALLDPELEQTETALYADLTAQLLLEISQRLQQRGVSSWMAILADAREELARGTGDPELRRTYLELANRAAVAKSATD